MKVLFDGSSLGGDSACFQKTGVYALGEDLEELEWVPETLDVG